MAKKKLKEKNMNERDGMNNIFQYILYETLKNPQASVLSCWIGFWWKIALRKGGVHKWRPWKWEIADIPIYNIVFASEEQCWLPSTDNPSAKLGKSFFPPSFLKSFKGLFFHQQNFFPYLNIDKSPAYLMNVPQTSSFPFHNFPSSNFIFRIFSVELLPTRDPFAFVKSKITFNEDEITDFMFCLV